MSNIKIIKNYKEYYLSFVDNDLICTPKDTHVRMITPNNDYISEDEFNNIDMTKSKILECIVKSGEEIISKKTHYASILKDIWTTMPRQLVLNTNIIRKKESNENGKNGYLWYENLQLSYRSADAITTMKEIMHMIKVNGYSIDITIRLANENIIKFRNDIV
jgi:hypothetical protein